MFKRIMLWIFGPDDADLEEVRRRAEIATHEKAAQIRAQFRWKAASEAALRSDRDGDK